MNDAIALVMNDFGDMFSFGATKQLIVSNNLIESEEVLLKNWSASLEPVFTGLQMTVPEIPIPTKNGRNGEHTKDLDEALLTLSEVYRVDPVASW